MEYLSTSEIAQKWNISRRRVTTLCIQGRIEGAIHKGNMWLVPENSPKPLDPRRVQNIGQAERYNTDTKEQHDIDGGNK